MDWRIGGGLADWSWIGRLVRDWWIGPGLTLDWRIVDGLADWPWIDRLAMDRLIGGG